ncbi:glycosyltransferase family 2 protein [Candidatus Roizmanbacteria bacterium]|nr:glycosyltransferase family 2 protein [Candidatus Roizmanbacteria bacterium]
MTEKLADSRYFRKFSDVLVPFLSWIIITLPLWLSFFHPAVASYFILAFDLYFLYKSVTTTYLAVLSYKKVVKNSTVNYAQTLTKISGSSALKHFIIIPNYKEPLHKLEATIKALTQQDIPFKNTYLVLAFEKRETEAKEKERLLKSKYRAHFQDILVAYHQLQENEVPGKASNQTFAARLVEQYTIKHGFDNKNILVTICDADSLLPANYLSYLSCSYLADQDRSYHFYCAPVLFYNNFHQLPFFVRIQATLSSIVRLAFLSQKEHLIQVSTYSTNLWLLREINYWDVDIIPEDWHIFFQAFFTFGEKVRAVPLFTIINGDAVYSGGLLKTLANRYEQEKRWAWGASDIGYALKKFFTTPHIKPWVKFKKVFFLMETHLLWPTSFFLLTISASIPPLVNPLFKRTVLGFLLPRLSALILTFASLLLIFYVYFDIKLRQKLKVEVQLRSIPVLIFQWYFLPIVSFLFSSLPALEAHTRLLLGKKIKYKVTEKV